MLIPKVYSLSGFVHNALTDPRRRTERRSTSTSFVVRPNPPRNREEPDRLAMRSPTNSSHRGCTCSKERLQSSQAQRDRHQESLRTFSSYNLNELTHADLVLQVVKACQSLTSRGYLKTQFSWQWYYYTLTPEGLDYLREWLHLPAEIVPATHIKQQRSHAPPKGMMGGGDDQRRGGGRGGPRGDRGDREGGYRRRDAGEGKEGGAPGDFAPNFRGGFGRGAGRGGPPPA